MIKKFASYLLRIVVLVIMIPTTGFAQNLLSDYGTQKYDLIIDMMVSTYSRDITATHRNRKGIHEREAYGNRGRFNVAILGTEEPEIQYYRPTWFHVNSDVTEAADIAEVQKCSAMGLQSLHDSKIGAEENMQVYAADLYKWQVYREPRPLRYSRYKIYFIRRAISKLSRKLKVEKNANKVAVLEKLIQKLKDGHELFTVERSELLEKDLKWHVRRGFWLNLNRNYANCSYGKPLDIPLAVDEYDNNSYVNIVAYKLQEFVDRHKKLKK